MAKSRNIFKDMDLNEFVEEGYLQEVNRNFFHPLGLALYASVDDTTKKVTLGVLDSRNDSEGIIFGTDDPAVLARLERKAKHISTVWAQREKQRLQELGYVIQPITENE